jgi:hypothetical protein
MLLQFVALLSRLNELLRCVLGEDISSISNIDEKRNESSLPQKWEGELLTLHQIKKR